MAHQESFSLRSTRRGTTEITAQVAAIVARAGVEAGVAHVFVRHTSCSVLITENAAAAVRRDLEMLAQRWAPDGDAEYEHDDEGPDDMAAHARTLLAGTSVSVPVANGCMLLGTWQGIYLWEHRTQGHLRELVVTITG